MMLRFDLAATGIPYVDDTGRFADFHAAQAKVVDKASCRLRMPLGPTQMNAFLPDVDMLRPTTTEPSAETPKAWLKKPPPDRSPRPTNPTPDVQRNASPPEAEVVNPTSIHIEVLLIPANAITEFRKHISRINSLVLVQEGTEAFLKIPKPKHRPDVTRVGARIGSAGIFCSGTADPIT